MKKANWPIKFLKNKELKFSCVFQMAKIDDVKSRATRGNFITNKSTA